MNDNQKIYFGVCLSVAIAGTYTFSMIHRPLDNIKFNSQTTNSPSLMLEIMSEYHPSMSSGSDGAGFAEGYARMQIIKNSETGLVEKVNGEKIKW